MSGKVKAFAHYGAVLTNDQWSWSARTPSGDVIVTLWKDEIRYDQKPPFYRTNDKYLSEWSRRPGNRERIKHLRWARENCNSRARVVIVRAVDPDADPREIAEAYPAPGMVLKLLELNEETGQFSGEIERAADASRS